jgi:hypothetical protein
MQRAKPGLNEASPLISVLGRPGEHRVVLSIIVAITLGDACHARIPAPVQELLINQFPAHRLPEATDTDPDVLREEFSLPNSASPCVLVASGDFNGDGQEDLAALLPERAGEKTLLVVAMQTRDGWLAESLFEHWLPRGALYVLPALPNLI